MAEVTGGLLGVGSPGQVDGHWGNQEISTEMSVLSLAGNDLLTLTYIISALCFKVLIYSMC